MSKKYKGRIEGSFLALLKDTIKTEAWKALSHCARSLYVALHGRYNQCAARGELGFPIQST